MENKYNGSFKCVLITKKLKVQDWMESLFVSGYPLRLDLKSNSVSFAMTILWSIEVSIISARPSIHLHIICDRRDRSRDERGTQVAFLLIRCYFIIKPTIKRKRLYLQ